jgi:hypothetical protein
LADLSITAAGQPSERVVLRKGKLVWSGELPALPTSLDVTYTAVGKGLYELSVLPGGILDQFQVDLVANGSDVQLLEWLALGGLVLPAIVILAITLAAAIWKPLQGILLTAEALGFFITAMMLMPTTQTGPNASPVAVEPPASAPNVPPVLDAQERPSDGG